jgi:hypothetical protein
VCLLYFSARKNPQQFIYVFLLQLFQSSPLAPLLSLTQLSSLVQFQNKFTSIFIAQNIKPWLLWLETANWVIKEFANMLMCYPNNMGIWVEKPMMNNVFLWNTNQPWSSYSNRYSLDDYWYMRKRPKLPRNIVLVGGVMASDITNSKKTGICVIKIGIDLCKGLAIRLRLRGVEWDSQPKSTAEELSWRLPFLRRSKDGMRP